MGYEVHITRKNEWFEEDAESISLNQWKQYVQSDPEMRLDNCAEATTDDGEYTLRTEREGIAVWTAWDKHDENGNMAWFYYNEGNIDVTSPEQAIVVKMHQIATALNAKVQGDDCETYDSHGEAELEMDSEMDQEAPRPWWKFW